VTGDRKAEVRKNRALSLELSEQIRPSYGHCFAAAARVSELTGGWDGGEIVDAALPLGDGENVRVRHSRAATMS
jgi:hypothetical protein